MNKILDCFIKQNFQKPAKALDLGAGDYADVISLKKAGWVAKGVDLKSGVNLENVYNSGEKFDLVYSSFVIHKILNKENFLKTIIQNLKENGFVFILTFDESDQVSSSKLNTMFFNSYLKNDFVGIKTRILDVEDRESGYNHNHRVLQVIARRK